MNWIEDAKLSKQISKTKFILFRISGCSKPDLRAGESHNCDQLNSGNASIHTLVGGQHIAFLDVRKRRKRASTWRYFPDQLKPTPFPVCQKAQFQAQQHLPKSAASPVDRSCRHSAAAREEAEQEGKVHDITCKPLGHSSVVEGRAAETVACRLEPPLAEYPKCLAERTNPLMKVGR